MPPDSPDQNDAWLHALQVTRPALVLAPRRYLWELRHRLAAAGVVAAVAERDTATVYDWIVGLLARQGISNHAAEVFAQRRGNPTWADVAGRLTAHARCLRLRSHWHFDGCVYRRSTGTCSVPHHQLGCPVVSLPARKGSLAEAAVALRLFIRDVCDDDFVSWIDSRLAAADPGLDHPERAAAMRDAALLPLINIVGTGPKVWAMILAELLLAGDPHRQRWVAAGASFVAIDSLVHGFMHRTGILHRLGADHRHGPACTAPGGCADIIAGLAARIDARAFNPAFPHVFPRWVQFAIWRWCAAGGLDICNGNRIDDAVGCQQRFCPSFSCCKKMVIQPTL